MSRSPAAPGGGAAASAAATADAIEALAARAIARALRHEDPALELAPRDGVAAAAGGGAGGSGAPLCAQGPGGGFVGARGLASALRVLATSHELLRKARTVTQRELYYLHGNFFKDAKEAAAALARAQAALGGVPRHTLGVLAAGRGWFAGAVSVREESDAAEEVWVPAARPRPVPSASVCEEQPLRCDADVAFVLVVEKECVFRRLAEERLWQRPGLRCGIPVFALTDYNPFGLAIALNYAHGSRASPDADAFNVPELEWLGLRHADLEDFALPPGGMQLTSAADEAKAQALLKDPRVAAQPALAFECERWLATRRKCEIEALMGAGAGLEYLANYIAVKVGSALSSSPEGAEEGMGVGTGAGEGAGVEEAAAEEEEGGGREMGEEGVADGGGGRDEHDELFDDDGEF
jgi:DNA topoisomerase VI subunit A